MKKEILSSIKPEWVEKILSGKKTIEIRKQFPKDCVGWVYIYCSKGCPLFKESGSYDNDSHIIKGVRIWKFKQLKLW